jgi:hypothetical protein
MLMLFIVSYLVVGGIASYVSMLLIPGTLFESIYGPTSLWWGFIKMKLYDDKEWRIAFFQRIVIWPFVLLRLTWLMVVRLMLALVHCSFMVKLSKNHERKTKD